MAERSEGGGVVNANAASVKAEVNGGRLVQLWRIDGRSAYVEPSDVQQYLSEGWSLQPSDPDALAHDLGPRFAAAERAVRAFYEGVKKDGQIDGSDEAQHSTAVRAMEELTAHVGRLLEVVGLTTPVAQAPAEEAEGVSFDPSQVLVRTGEGRVIAVAREDAHLHEVLAEGRALKDEDPGDNARKSGDELGPGANNAIGAPQELADFHAAEARALAEHSERPEAPNSLVAKEEAPRASRRRR